MTTRTEADQPSEEPYICIDKWVGRWLHKYFNETLSFEKTQSFEQHLMLCFKCQETLFSLDAIYEAIRANQDQLFGPEEQSKKKSVTKTRNKA